MNTSTSTSLFAKALATENIFVSFDATAKTATFDVSSRTLIIPDWKVTPILRDMIVAHEVAHALYTPASQLLSALEGARNRKLDPNGYKACINVIEDARIERLIKEKFPGCRRDFYGGYKEIYETDLFGIRSLTVDEMTIVDKINLNFKFGAFGLMNIPLNNAEADLMRRISNTKTFEDVVALADELYAVLAEETEEAKKQGKDPNDNGTASGDLTTMIDRNSKRDGNPDKCNSSSGKIKVEDFPNASYALPKCNSNEAIIPFADILQDARYMENKVRQAYVFHNRNHEITILDKALTDAYADLETYRKDASVMVRELVAQFERRKAAEEIRRERMKPTGEINPDRLHQFKTHEDIFLRNLIRNEGKKHGVVMLIDWSGSMSNCIDGLIRQVLLLTWFCRKAKIPYEVMLYTEHGGFSDPSLNKHDTSANDYYLKRMERMYGSGFVAMLKHDHLGVADVALRQVFSSSMSNEDTLAMERLLWTNLSSFSGNGDYSYALSHVLPSSMMMHGTPSCEALMAIHDFVPKFREATGSQIVDFIFITDGDPTGLSQSGRYAYIPKKNVRVQHLATGRTLTIDVSKTHQRNFQQEVQYFLADEIRKLGCVTVGFSIGSMSGIGSHYLAKLVRPMNHLIKHLDLKTLEGMDKNYNDFYKKENFIPCCPDKTPGFDEYYVMRPVRPTFSEQDDNLNASNATITRIRNSFLRSLIGKKCSRVFLSRFIDLMAGRKLQRFKIMG